MGMPLCELDCGGPGHGGFNASLSVAHSLNNLVFRLNGFGRRKLATWHLMATLYD
jgi:hypothetical protein